MDPSSRFDVGDEVVFKSLRHDNREYIGLLIGAVVVEPGYRNRLVLSDIPGFRWVTDDFIRSYDVDLIHRMKKAVELFEHELLRVASAMPDGGYYCFECKDPNPYAEANFKNVWICRACRSRHPRKYRIVA